MTHASVLQAEVEDEIADGDENPGAQRYCHCGHIWAGHTPECRVFVMSPDGNSGGPCGCEAFEEPRPIVRVVWWRRFWAWLQA